MPANRWDHLAKTPLPVIAALKDVCFLILGRIGHDNMLVRSPREPGVLSRGILVVVELRRKA